MRSDLRSIVESFLEWNSVPPIVCSEYSAFDALSEIVGEEVFGREDVVKNPRPEIFAFEPTIKTKEPTYAVADVREIIAKSNLSSESGKKAVVLFDADTMTSEAANAFLKTLEDVPPGTFFILTVKSRAKMLETVLSRSIFIDSWESALEASENSKLAINALFERSDAAPLATVMFKKPDRAECLAILELVSKRVRLGEVSDESTLEALEKAFSTIASTNVVPYWELDRVVLKLFRSFRPDSQRARP